MRHMNGDATEMIPIRFMISVAIIAAILVLVAVASQSLGVSLAEHQVEQECLLVQSSLSTMIASGSARDIDSVDTAEGTQRIQTLMLPDSLIYLSFGGVPDPLNSGELHSSLTENGAVISYRVQGGSNHVLWLPKDTYKLREGVLHENIWVLSGAGESYIVRHGGTLRLVFELVQQNHETYILIHANDGIE